MAGEPEPGHVCGPLGHELAELSVTLLPDGAREPLGQSFNRAEVTERVVEARAFAIRSLTDDRDEDPVAEQYGVRVIVED